MSSENTIFIKYISHNDGGTNDLGEYGEGITIGELFSLKESGDFDAFSVRVNGQLVTDRDEELSNGDRVSVSPKNIKGY